MCIPAGGHRCRSNDPPSEGTPLTICEFLFLCVLRFQDPPSAGTPLNNLCDAEELAASPCMKVRVNKNYSCIVICCLDFA